MKKHQEKKKFGNQNNDKRQLSLLTFFSLKQNSNEDVPLQRNSSIISDEDHGEGDLNSNSSSPDLIEATPKSKSLAVSKLSSQLNFAVEVNERSSPSLRKKLFVDSSNTVINKVGDEENILKSDNREVNGFKRSSDDVFDELLEEIENSPPSCSTSSKINHFGNSINRKRMKLCSSRLEERILEESLPIFVSKETENYPSRNLLTPKKKCNKFSHVQVDDNCRSSNSTEAKMKNDTTRSIDIENLGDLLNDDFNTFVIDELNLNSWTYCEVIMVERIQFGVRTLVKEVTCKRRQALSTSCYIKGYWGESPLKSGDLVSLKARYDHSLNSWLVDEKGGFLVKYPNLLVTGTNIVGSLFCLRKAVLNYLFPGSDHPNISMLVGSLVHELFQEILKNKLYKEKDMKLIANNLLSRRRTLLDSYKCDISLSKLESELDKFLPRIVSFIDMYMLNKDCSRKIWAGQIQEILSIEENFWVPQLGIKGKTDLIIKASTDAKIMIMPVEIKTGRPTNSVEHRGQILLYLMMMTELNMDVDTGLLLYLKDNIIHEIIPRQGEINGLVTIRNNLVDYFMKTDKMSLSSDKLFSVPPLPEPIDHHSACSKCPYLTVCSAALSKETDVKLSKRNPLGELSLFSVQHLSSSHIEYVFHWLGLLRLEGIGKNSGRFADVSDIWLVDSEDRQKRGGCIPQLNITDVEVCENYFLHHCKRSDDNFDFTSSGIVDHDYIVVSSNNRFAIATGFVHHISETTLILKLDRKLNKHLEISYVVDKYTGNEGLLGFNCSNLLLLLENSDAAAMLRSFIIDLKLPSFTHMSKNLSNECYSILSTLNSCQKEAISKALSAENFTLIKGLPGTGKTATIIALIKVLVQLNHSVLITSHTHSAVDNVLIQLKDSVDFLRLGSSKKVHSAIKSHCEDVLISEESINSTEDVENFYNKKQVVGVTCMGCSHVLLSKIKFDVCIIDEATQVLQPSLIKALYSARKFILIGDPDQLPPVVHNLDASRLGLSESLFHRLDRPEVTTTLHLQYRMNSEIMKLANAFAYKNQLKCGSENINSATIEVNCSSAIVCQHSWLKLILSSNLLHSLVFLNTQNLTMSNTSSVYSNYLEVNVASIITDALKQNFKNMYDVGIIAPYREQVQLLKKYISKTHADVEINTVDQFQGRDKDVIIFSSTRWSNEKEEGILGDERRLTVAVTRAKKKLIVIGNASILQKCSTFNKLLALISCKNMIDVNEL